MAGIASQQLALAGAEQHPGSKYLLLSLVIAAEMLPGRWCGQPLARGLGGHGALTGERRLRIRHGVSLEPQTNSGGALLQRAGEGREMSLSSFQTREKDGIVFALCPAVTLSLKLTGTEKLSEIFLDDQKKGRADDTLT